jgi:hypothetical protein
MNYIFLLVASTTHKHKILLSIGGRIIPIFVSQNEPETIRFIIINTSKLVINTETRAVRLS